MVKDKKTIYFDEFDKLRDILYSYHIAGGPLHILTDDGNVEDSHLDHCEERVCESDDPYWLTCVMLAILEMIREIPDVESRELFLMGQDIKVSEV